MSFFHLVEVFPPALLVGGWNERISSFFGWRFSKQNPLIEQVWQLVGVDEGVHGLSG